jgi:hypothetical protein
MHFDQLVSGGQNAFFSKPHINKSICHNSVNVVSVGVMILTCLMCHVMWVMMVH